MWSACHSILGFHVLQLLLIMLTQTEQKLCCTSKSNMERQQHWTSPESVMVIGRACLLIPKLNTKVLSIWVHY